MDTTRYINAKSLHIAHLLYSLHCGFLLHSLFLNKINTFFIVTFFLFSISDSWLCSGFLIFLCPFCVYCSLNVTTNKTRVTCSQAFSNTAWCWLPVTWNHLFNSPDMIDQMNNWRMMFSFCWPWGTVKSLFSLHFSCCNTTATILSLVTLVYTVFITFYI